MDVTLDRIIQELKTQRKRQSDLTDFLGLSDSTFGNWKVGLNSSYTKYLHAIASYLDVSVEYLKGETDIKKPPIENDERLDEVYELVKDLDESEQMALKAFVAGLKANRKPD
jgi:transcriptional regulator with XRE-family HTH domain